jgi:hypothetical protein
MNAVAAPVIDDGKLYQGNRQFFDHYVLKNAHHRDFIAHLQPHVVAQKRVNEL